MEEDGSLSYWSVLFKASSFADFLDRLNMIEEINAADQRRLQDLDQAHKEVEQYRSELLAQKDALQVKKDDLAAKRDDLAEASAEKDALLETLLARGLMSIKKPWPTSAPPSRPTWTKLPRKTTSWPRPSTGNGWPHLSPPPLPPPGPRRPPTRTTLTSLPPL